MLGLLSSMMRPYKLPGTTSVSAFHPESLVCTWKLKVQQVHSHPPHDFAAGEDC